MRKDKRIFMFVPIIFLIIISLYSCSDRNKAPARSDKISVVLEDGEGFTAKPNVIFVESGDDALFHIKLEGGMKILSCDYKDYEIVDEAVSQIDKYGYQLLILHNVRYSTVVSVNAYSPHMIEYYANGGERKDGGNSSEPVILEGSTGHLRTNTALGNDIFEKDGYVLVSWNTKADGSGERIGIGSRVDSEKNDVLYAVWAQAPENGLFTYREDERGLFITGLRAETDCIVIPAYIDGIPVKGISSSAFGKSQAKELVLPETLEIIEPDAFRDAAIETVTFYDSLTDVSDDSFRGCSIRTIHVNAVKKPVYSGTYFDTFPDKVDWLKSLAEQKKIVLFSGSSARFGYDSEMIDEAFEDYTVANMGVYAYSSSKPQYELILGNMKRDDVLIVAPEFDAIEEQFCATDNLWYEFFAMTESNYDLLSELDMRNYSHVWDDFREYQKNRLDMPAKNYSVTPKNHDEDGNIVGGMETYNKYGDYIYPRPNQETEGLFGIKRATYLVEDFPEETVECLNAVLEKFIEKGIKVFFSYAPRSEKSVTEGSDKDERSRLDAYLREKLSVPVISGIEESIYNAIYFYGTDNHLSDEGVDVRTERIIDDLKNQLY